MTIKIIEIDKNYKFEILDNWSNNQLQSEWNELHLESDANHPFTTYEWIDCWYHSFVTPGTERIIILKDKKSVRTILPGMLIKKKIGGINFDCFSYANNEHSFRSGFIAKKDDFEGIIATIYAINILFKKKIHILCFPMIKDNSLNNLAIAEFKYRNLSLYIEHSYESPYFDISRGFENYLGTRSKNFRKRIKQSLNRAKRLGAVEYDIIENFQYQKNIENRLKAIESKTWQSFEGTGLFSTIESSEFYRCLINKYSIKRKIIIAFLKIEGIDVAYEIATTFKTTAFLLKCGYDPKYSDCSPGALIQIHLVQYLSLIGIKDVDLLGEKTDEKVRWGTNVIKQKNFFLINSKTFKGKCLLIALRARNSLTKKFISSNLIKNL